MKNFVVILLVAIITLSIVFAIYRPDILERVWLWVVGLIGPIIGIGRLGINKLNSFLQSLDKSKNINNS